MKRLTSVLLALTALACADLPTAAPPASKAAAPTVRFAVTFADNGEFSFDTSTDCAASGLNIQCYLKIIDGGSRTAVELSVYGNWNADAVCVHSKTGKVAPARHQPTNNPQLWNSNYAPTGGVALNGGVAEVASLTLTPPSAANVNNPCSFNKGAYTAVQWQNITPAGWLAIAFESAGIATASAAESF
jgi:hypothetical protein